MTIGRWETESEISIHESKFGSVRNANRRREADGKRGSFLLFDFSDWVNVVATTEDDELILIRQFRQGTESVTLEIPGGNVDPEESFLEAAKRELEEETGYRSGDWVELGVIHPNPANQSNRCALFWAKNATPTGEIGWDEHEEIEVVKVSASGVSDLVRREEITHSLVISALYFWELSR